MRRNDVETCSRKSWNLRTQQVPMTQLLRRVIYLVAGLVPACCGALVASAMRGPLLLGALAGACGLLLASMDVFPVRRATYWCIAILLGAGLAAMLPFSV